MTEPTMEQRELVLGLLARTLDASIVSAANHESDLRKVYDLGSAAGSLRVFLEPEQPIGDMPVAQAEIYIRLCLSLSRDYYESFDLFILACRESERIRQESNSLCVH